MKQVCRFRDIRRGHISFLILLVLVGVASLDNLVVGKRALIVRYEGHYYFPFVTEVLSGTTFGLKDEAETDYRELQRQFRLAKSPNWVLLPLVPYDPKLDTPEVIEEVERRVADSPIVPAKRNLSTAVPIPCSAISRSRNARSGPFAMG